MIGGPIEERVRRCSCDLCNCGGHQCRLAYCGGPGVEQHIEQRRGPDGDPLTPPLVGWDLFEAERAPNRTTDGGYLLRVSQGLRPGQNIFSSCVSVLAQGADGD